MNNQLTRYAGWAAYLSGITALLSCVGYIVFVVFDLPQTMQGGNANQQTLATNLGGLFQGISVLLMIPIALALHQITPARSAKVSRVAMIIGIVGMAVFLTFNTLIFLLGMPESQAGAPISFAFGAVGAWLITANYFARGIALPTRLAWLGIVIGAGFVLWMLMFRISGAANVGSPAALQSNTPFLIGIAALALSSYFLYPIWAIWLGRVLMKTAADGRPLTKHWLKVVQ